MKLRSVRVIVFVAALGCVTFGALAWMHRVDPAASEQYDRKLHALVTLDHQLTSAMLQARSGVVEHYDGIAAAEAALHRLHIELRNPPEFLSVGSRTALIAGVQASEVSRRDTQRLIERFKSQHAVLRNSLRALPTLAAGIDAFTPTSEDEAALRTSVSALVRDVLLLRGAHDPALLYRVEGTLARLQALARDRSAAGLDLGLVLQHARIVHDRSQEVNELVRAALASPMQAKAEALIRRYGIDRQAAMDAASTDATVFFLCALLLVASAAAYVIVRLRESSTQLRRSTAQLAQANESLRIEQAKQKELGELKTRFVSMTSHEFRTPLSIIVSSSEMLTAYASSWARERQDDHLARIRRAALDMTKMLDSILLIGKSDAGMLTLQAEALDLDTLCTHALEAAEQGTGKRGQVTLRLDEGAHGAIWADEKLLRQILENLLTNALKYSTGTAAVQFDIRREGDDTIFDVRDHGIGIAMEDQQHLFESFHRGKNVGKIAGTGLGLAIVKRAVDLHGGTVVVCSELGQGSTFTVRIPSPRQAA